MPLRIADVELESRFFLGTAGYPSPQVLQEAIAASGTQVVTVGLKRVRRTTDNDIAPITS